ncbi:MAG: 4-hydroxy-tetrahydrodipicolinate synthase [Pseudomonadota bacterium]
MFRGSITALVTPFKNGAVEEASFVRLLERQIAAGTHGVVPCGTTGEVATLSDDEFQRLIALTVEVCGGRIPVIAGTGTNDTARTIARQRYAQSVGADAGLVIAPYYNRPDQAGIAAHIEAVADASDLPVIVYNVPGRTVTDISPATLARLSAHPRIIGVKDATGEMGRVTRHKLDCRKGFVQLSGDDPSALGHYAHGGAGAISVTSNVAPAQCAAFHQACLDGEWDEARAINARLQALHEALFCAPSPAPAKYALSALGLCEAELRLPLVACDDVARRRVDAAMAGLDLS